MPAQAKGARDMSYIRFNRSVVAWLAWTMAFGLATTTAGQQRESTLSPPEYIIEFHTPEGCFFAPIVAAAKRGFLVYALPRPGNYLPDSSGQPILSKIAVNAEQSGELWNLKGSIGVGEFYDAGDKQLAAFTLHTNERADVGEAARFGLGPFRVGVVKVLGQTASSQPRITFKTQSISVDKVEVNPLPEPYRLFLKNNSDKDVLAIQYNTYRNRQMVQLKWLAPPQPLSLIKAGEVYPLQVLSEDRTCAGAEGYQPSQSNMIEIASVVFVDGSYEGDSGLAAVIRGQSLGNKRNLDRVISLLNAAEQNNELVPELLTANMKTLSEAMDDTAEPDLLEVLKRGLPPQGDNAATVLTNFIRSGQHDVKRNLLSDALILERLIRTADRAAVNECSVRMIAKYKQWQARAESVSGP
jgi:hypothetical protein